MFSRKSSSIENSKWFFCAVTIFLSVLLYIKNGYQTGLGDGPEFLTFALKYQHPELYKNDLFMQSMLGMGWNERTFFGLFFSVFPNLEWAGFVAHVFITIGIVAGTLIVSNYILNNLLWATIATMTILLPLQNIDLGSTTLYFNNIQGESFANLFCIWAFVCWLYNKKSWSIVMIVAATFFHPLIGLQVFIMFLGAYVFTILLTKNTSDLKIVVYASVFYFVCVGWYILKILLGHQNESTNVSEAEFIDLTFHFVSSCHFEPHSFSRKGYILTIFSMVTGLFWYRKNNLFFHSILLILLLGYVIYVMGYYSNIFFIITSQWFRTTMWAIFLGIIAFFALIKKNGVVSKAVLYSSFALSLLFAFLPNKSPHYYPWINVSLKDDEIEMANACKRLTDTDAVFIQPYQFSALKYHGERASYVELFRVLRARKDIKVWYGRLFQVYHLDKETKTARNENLDKILSQNYDMLSDNDLQNLNRNGVGFAIFPVSHKSDFVTLYQNKTYKLLRIGN